MQPLNSDNKKLIFEINLRCISCDNCRIICPDNAVLKVREKFMIDSYACTLCGLCLQVCPSDAIKEVLK